MDKPWNPHHLPKLDGRRIVVTGGNAGLGYFTCEQLAEAGASVVLAARSEQRARAAIASLRNRVPEAEVTYLPLDLASLRSIRLAADTLGSGAPIDGFVANAGVIGSSRYQTTTDGFELQFGTNYLGHYALTSMLLPAFHAAGTRIVHLGSISHRWARLAATSLDPGRYRNYRAYATSKLAVMTYGFELARLLELAGRSATSVVAHPGLALSSLTPQREGLARSENSARPRRRAPRWVAQGKNEGAWPIVRAVADPALPTGSYCGPDGPFQLRGEPALVEPAPHAHDRNAASQLLDFSAAQTGIHLTP